MVICAVLQLWDRASLVEHLAVSVKNLGKEYTIGVTDQMHDTPSLRHKFANRVERVFHQSMHSRLRPRRAVACLKKNEPPLKSPSIA